MTASELEPIEFRAWPKTPRLRRDITITEKIDGTNGAIIVTEDGRVAAQSRNRLITPGKATDNYGFAGWVYANAGELADLLGPGHHYGEWWGSGIQRNYGLTGGEKRFSLFNAHRYGGMELRNVDGLGVVPVLYQGPWGNDAIDETLAELRISGSYAEPGFMSPEGVIVYHAASKQVFKVLIENDELPKGLAA